MRRTAAEERELLRRWNAGAPIDGREREPPLNQRPIDDYADDDEPEWEEDAFDEDECGWMGPQLGCSAAGTEDCDWECPTRAMLYRQARLERRRRAKKDKG